MRNAIANGVLGLAVVHSVIVNIYCFCHVLECNVVRWCHVLECWLFLAHFIDHQRVLYAHQSSQPFY